MILQDASHPVILGEFQVPYPSSHYNKTLRRFTSVAIIFYLLPPCENVRFAYRHLALPTEHTKRPVVSNSLSSALILETCIVSGGTSNPLAVHIRGYYPNESNPTHRRPNRLHSHHSSPHSRWHWLLPDIRKARSSGFRPGHDYLSLCLRIPARSVPHRAGVWIAEESTCECAYRRWLDKRRSPSLLFLIPCRHGLIFLISFTSLSHVLVHYYFIRYEPIYSRESQVSPRWRRVVITVVL